MASKFSEFLAANKIDPRRVVAASRRLETLRPEDRRLRLAKRKGTGDKPASAEVDQAKPRSGRPVSAVLLRRVEAGGKVTGPAKQKLLRAVNSILEQRKKDPVELRALF
jgi:hypothetical protein